MSQPDDEIRNPDDAPTSDAFDDASLEDQPGSPSDASPDRPLEPDAAADDAAGGGAPLDDDADFVPPADPDETLDFAAPADMESGIGFEAMGAEGDEQAEVEEQIEVEEQVEVEERVEVDTPAGDELLPDFAAGDDEFGAEKAADETGEPEEEAEPKKKPAERVQGVLAAIGKSDPYTVLLGIALVALLTGIFFFYMELSAYNFDIWAERAKQLFGSMGLLRF